MKKFAQAAKDLQIRKLTENIRMGNPPETRDALDKSKEDINQDNNKK